MSEIIQEVASSYNEYLTKIVSGSMTIADTLRSDQISDAMQMIMDFSEGMGWLVDAGNLLKQNEVDVTLDAEKIHDFLHEINTGLENQDYVLVADMFEYEIAPFFEGIQPLKMGSN